MSVPVSVEVDRLIGGAGIVGCSPSSSHLTAYNRGCRCPACTEANRIAHRLRRDRRKAEGLPTWIAHGTVSGNTSGCRCDLCRAAKRNYEKLRRQRLMGADA